MEVRVQFFAFFREYGASELVVKLSRHQCRITDLLAQLASHLGDKFAREVRDEAASNPDLLALIYVGNASILNLNQLNTALKDGDTVKFLPPMAGG